MQIHILLDGKFFDNRPKDVIRVDICIITIISITTILHTSSGSLLLFKRLLDSIYFIESVKFCHDLTKNWLTITDQQVQEFLILFDIVSLLLA